MMKAKVTLGQMVMFLAMGFAVIINLVATSRYEFYPYEFVTGAAMAVGISMVVGTIAFFMREPKTQDIKLNRPALSGGVIWKILANTSGGLPIARKVPAAAGA